MKMQPDEKCWWAIPVGNNDGTWDGENPEGADAFPTEGEAVGYAREIVRSYGGPDFIIYECTPRARIVPRVSTIVQPLPRPTNKGE